MAELQVPVRLQIQNLQSLISDLQNKLGNLKVGSAGFKSVQNLIMSIKNEIDKLQIQTSKPFINENQFTKAENSVDKLEDELRRVEITLGRIKFSDLELNPQQKADLKAFEDQINAIKANLKTVKDTAKQDFLGSAMGKLWTEKFDETVITKSFSQITNNIRAEVLKQKDIVKEAQEAFNSYQNAMKANNSIDQFLKTKNPLEEANLGAEKYAQIFQNTKAGLRFRSGGSTILEEWLKTQLELDDATIKGLVEGSAQKVKAQLEERLKAIKLANSEVINKNVSAETDYTNESARLQQLNQIMQQLGFSEQSVAVANQALRAQLNDTTNAMAEYQDKAVEAARGNQDVKDTTNAMMSQLSSLRSTLQQTNAQFIQMQRTQQSFNQMKMAVVNFMGFNQVLNLTKNAIRNAINHIKELDTVMNNISIVTDMSTSDLWDQVDAYSKMAQTYGVSIKGAYEVSQIYYQQGLETADVLTLTNETLKLAKISGLDYATTTDYMTTALRGFKMEMSEASTVVDVYSNLAANTAVSQEELAVAMSRTASSMESVGATFEETSAMIGTMVAVTRESATNIGSAMKSIASRYGELTKDPTKLVDEEGEAMAFNKVDTALQSVGISMKTVDGQFREFTDVIVELGEKWDQLDSTQQRYIATQFAGNRQQSRFLALVSNVDLLKSNLDVAMNSEDTGTLQALKALDSIEAKTEQVRVAYQQFYTTIGAENVWKGFLDVTKNVINTLNSFPKLFGKLPIAAIVAVSGVVKVIKDLGIKLISGIAEVFGTGFMQGLASASGQAQAGAEGLFNTIINTIKSKLGIATQTGKEIANAVTSGAKDVQVQLSPAKQAIVDNNQEKIDTYQKAVKGIAVTDPQDIADAYQNMAFNMQRSKVISTELYDTIQKEPQKAKQVLDDYFISLSKHNEELRKTGIVAQESSSKIKQFAETHKGAAKGLQTFGSALQMAAMLIDTSKEGGKTLSGTLMSISGAATLAGSAWQVFTASIKAGSFALNSIPWMAVISGIFAVINGISTLVITPEERIAELKDAAEELSNKAKESKAEYKTLQRSAEKLDELKEKRYESAEAAEEYQTAVDDLAGKFPALVSGFDEAGNAIIETSQMEAVLTAARERSASATYAAAAKEKELSEELLRTASSNASDTISKIGEGLQEFETEYSDERLNLNRLSWGENAGKDYRNMAMAFSMFDDTATQNFDTWSGEVLQSFLSSYSQVTIDELPLQAEKWFTDYGFNLELLNSSKTKEGDFNLQAYYDKLNKNVGTLGAADQEIYNILTTLVDETSGKIEIPEKASFENLSGLTEKINQAIQDGDLSLLYDYYNQFNEAYQQLKNSDFGQSYVNQERMSQLEAGLEELQGYINDMTDAAAKDVRNAAALISSYIVKNNGTDNFISDESGLVGIISANYSKKYQEEFKKNNKYTQEQFFKQYGTSLQGIINASESFWNDLVSHGTNIKDKFVSMIKNNENYRLSDFKQFESLDNWGVIETEIIETYQTRIRNIQDDLKNFFTSKGKIWNTQQRSAVRQVNTIQESQYLKDVFNEYYSLADNGLTNRSEAYLTNALNLFSESLKLSDELRIALWKSIEKNGLSTKEAIEKVRQEILNNDTEDDDSLAEVLLNMSNAMVDNVRLAIQMAASQFVDSWSDSSKTIKSLSSGLDLTEVEGLINSTAGQAAGLSMASFVSNGETLVLKASEIDNYIAKFFDTETATYDKRSQELEAASKIFSLTDTTKQADVEGLFTNIQTIDDFTKEQKEAFTTLLGSEEALKNYFSETDGLDTAGLAEALLKAYQESGKALENYRQYIQWARDQINSSRAWEKGDYSNLGDINLKDLSSGKLKLTMDDAQLKSAKESINSAYDTLISDVLSKGIENINLDDYTGIIAEQKPAIQQALIKGSYTEFINTYVQYAGKSIDEANDLIAQAIEKGNETVSVDLIKDFQFINGTTFKTSLSSLKELANKLNISLSDLLDKAVLSSNEAIDEYIVNAALIDNLDLNSAEFQNTIRDSINEFFSSLASYISNALKGSLSSENAVELQQFANQVGIGKLDFSQTADGLRVATDQAKQLVFELEKIDAIQGQIAFNELKDNLIETEDAYKTIGSNTAYIADLKRQLTYEKNLAQAYKDANSAIRDQSAVFAQVNGNVDMYNRPKYVNEDGSISTFFSETFNLDEFSKDLGVQEIPFAALFTPVISETEKWDSDQLDEYVYEVMQRAQEAADEAGSELTIDFIKGADTKNLLIDIQKFGDDAKAALEYENQLGQSIHEYSEAWEDARNLDEAPDNSSRIAALERELELAERINVVRGTAQDDSFNFMSNDIPAAQNNPLNYYKNWAEAIKAVDEAMKTSSTNSTGKHTGLIDYQDFYNIVNEINDLAGIMGSDIQVGVDKITGEAIKLNGDLQSAAELIEKGAAALTMTDAGDIKVALGDIGIDFSGGADSMAANVDDGVRAMAESQVKMLDGLIQMLEAIVAMEQLGDIDVEGNGIDLSDLFKVTYDEDGNATGREWYTEFTETYENWRQDIIDKIEAYDADPKHQINKDLVEAFRGISITLNGENFSLEQLIKFEPGDWKGKEELGNLYTSVINSMVKAAKSGNYDLDNIAASVQQELASSGLFDQPISIDVGDTTLVFTREGSVTIDWSSKDAQSVIEKAKSAYDNDIAKTKVALTEAQTTWQQGGTLDESINVEWMLELNHHIVTKDGKTGIEWNGNFYDDVNSKAYQAAAAAWRLKDAGINFTEKDIHYDAGEVVTTTTIGSKNNIIVRSTGTTLTYESDITGKTYDTPTAMQDDEYAAYSADFDENLQNRQTETKLTKEQWLWITYKIHTKTQPTFVDNNGKGIDLSADPTTRHEVNDLVSGGYDSIQKEIDNNKLIDNKDGTFTIPINGKMFTFESDGTNITQDLYNALSEFIGIDSTLVDSIAQGISNAFKGDAGAKIGKAIATGIKESLTPAEGEEQEISIPTLILKPESIKLANTDTSVNLSDNLDITATAGQITVNVDGQKATAVGTVTVDNLKGIGTGTLSVKNCKLTLLEDGSAQLTTESGKTIPIDNLVGSGTGTLSAGDCTFTFNDDGTVQFDQGETSIIIRDLVGTGIGTLSAGNCTLTYDAATGTATLTNGDTINISVPIPSDKITGSGILSAGQCAVTLDQNILTLANNSGSVSVAIPSTVLTGIGKLNKENCDISFTPTGDLQITTAEGTTYQVTIPEGSLNAVASLLKADVEWADKPVFNTDNITLPDSLVMGTIDGIVRVNTKYELNDAQQQSLDISKILGTTSNPDTIARTLGYQTIAVAKRQGMNNGENAPQVAAYLQNLRQMVAEGQQLSSLDLSNLDKLSLVGEKFSIDEMGGENLSTIISEITSLNSILSENNGLSQLESFSSIDGSNLLAVSTALQTISENASNLANISWADVLKNIQQINSDIEPVELQFELDSTHLEAAAEKIGASIPNIMGTAIEQNQSVFQNALSSVRTHIEELGTAVNTIFGDINHTIASIQQHVSITGEVTLETPVGDASTVSGIRDENGNITFNATVKTTTDATEVAESVAKVTAIANVITKTDPTEVINTITSLNVPTVEVPVQGRYVGTTDLPEGFSTTVSGSHEATGNFGLAKAAGTLMGELGPELVVQDGRYFVAGQNGAEFVNLQDDAIVFNHLQTEQLLKKGMSSTRGRAVTNERTAVAFAQGNVNGGPAMASASAALAALKQLRSMWASLASASVQDLAGAGGGGGGGGGDKDMAAYIKELEKWYNWLQKIAELEDKINYQEQLRSTISSSQRKNGSAYYSSLKDTLKNLQEQVKTEQSLIDAQQKYFDKRRKELNTNGPFNSLYTFDENGQLKYKKGALNKLSKLNETDKYGKPKMSSEQQYDYIVNTLGIDEQYLQTTATGEKIDTEQEGWQATAVQAFWDKMDADKEEMQSLHDSINEHSEALLAAQEQQNEILQEMRDNQLAVEKNVYDAIVDSRERAIEDAEAMRDALEESTTKFIDGLSSALDKERSMYEMQQSQTDLDQKRRRLAILQRTGGSNSEIASLQSDIASSERDLYFDKQQEQIDLIQEASDKQIEKLDQQIELDKELLEYQKAHGLLWSEVADIMKMDSAAITDFITSNNSEWWAKSPVQSAQDLQDAIFQTDQWVEFRDDQNSFFQNIIDTIYNTTTNAAPDNPTSTADSTTQLDGNDDNSGNTKTEYKPIKGNDKQHKKITKTKTKKGGWKTTKTEKEDHKFDKSGVCKKCKYKKKKTDDDGNKPTGNGSGSGGTGGNADNGDGNNGSGSNLNTATLTCIAYEYGGAQITKKVHKLRPGTYKSKDYEPSVGNKYTYVSAAPQSIQIGNNESGTIKYYYKLKVAENPSEDNTNPSTTSSTTSSTSSQSSPPSGFTPPSGYQAQPVNPDVNLGSRISSKDINLESKQTLQSLSDINLTQDEVQKLRTSTLSNGLSAVNSAMKMNLAAINSSAYTTIDREKSTQIGSISLNMDVKQIANDYDAKRAGEKAMEEMLRIARKSTTATVRR